jgi:hypothetical protein
MYYAVEIVSSLFLSGSLGGGRGFLPDSFLDVLDMDISSLFIVGEPSYRV